MNIRFKQILIPVDFTINTDVAIHHALALADPYNPVLHLLHVEQATLTSMIGHAIFPVFNRGGISDMNENIISNKLDSLKSAIRQERPEVDIAIHLIDGMSVEDAIINKAMEIVPDLILIAKKSHHDLLPFLNTVVPSRVAQRTRIPILTSKPGSFHHAIKTIVVPVGKKFPQKKIDIINALRKKTSLHIRLLALQEDEDSKQVSDVLIHVYRLLRQEALSDIQYEAINGKNKVRAILSYCKKVEADLLVVTPGPETRIGWLNKHISDVLPAASKTQVLAI